MERKENCSSENALYYARILFVWFCLLGQVGHVVAKRLKVEVETPGTLPELVGKKAKYKVTDLTLKGTLNGRDLCFLREMAGRDKERQSTPGRLRVLDMRYVSFARGGGGYVRHGEWREVQGEHTLPPYLFSECGLTHIDLPERLDTIAEGALGAVGSYCRKMCLWVLLPFMGATNWRKWFSPGRRGASGRVLSKDVPI